MQTHKEILLQEYINESIKSHIAAAGLGALATYGGMTASNSKQSTPIQIPQAAVQQQHTQNTQTNIQTQSTSNILDQIGYALPPSLSHLKDGLEYDAQALGFDSRSRYASSRLKKWEEYVFEILPKLNKTPEDLFVNPNNKNIRLRIKGTKSWSFNPSDFWKNRPPKNIAGIDGGDIDWSKYDRFIPLNKGQINLINRLSR